MTNDTGAGLVLGLDAGGTQTRWALAGADGRLQRDGAVEGLTGLQLDHAAGRAQMAATLAGIARAAGPVRALAAGVTGFDDSQLPLLTPLLAETFGVETAAVQAMNDIELACRAAFAPGAGHVLYAGTGSVAAFVDAHGVLHRAGGRGALIDDAGGGHWIAREALRRIWRAEDEAPGAWRHSALAASVFARIGGPEWAQTRQWAYGASRGELGTLALAVAEAAHAGDAQALAILHEAGRELARLALALRQRLGARPLALLGRAFDLHPAVQTALRAALPADTDLRRLELQAHHAAARLAAAAAAARNGRA